MRNALRHNSVTILAQGESAKGQILGTVFRKEIVRFGKWVNPLFPVEYMELDKEWAEKIIANFDSKVVGNHIPVPISHDDWDPTNNAGEVVKLEIENGGLVAYLDIRRPEIVSDILNGLIFDVSISFDWNFVDTEEGEEHGPALIHVALVNNPYLTRMGEFEQVAASFAAFSQKVAGANVRLAKRATASVIMLSESKFKELTMNFATVANDKQYPVTVKFQDAEGNEQSKELQPGETVEVPEEQKDVVTQQVTDAQAPDAGNDDADKPAGNDDKNTPPTGGDADKPGSGADGEGAGADGNDNKDDAAAELARYKTDERYRQLLSKGKIVPAQKDKFMELANVRDTKVQLSKDKSVPLIDYVADILEAGPKVLELDKEHGTGKDDGTVKLSQSEREEMKARGMDPDKYEQYVREGKIKPDEEE